MVAFALSIVVTVALVGVILAYTKHRPVGTPVTWGEAMFGAMIVFFGMFWIYGVVPHQWLAWADNELNWRTDKLFVGPGGILRAQAQGGSFPFTITYVVIRDIIASGIYVVAVAGQVALWMIWQNRGKKAEAAEAVELSSFGRPLVREGSEA
ncbi:MAG: hypothetical protein J4F50_01285 [Acidimicrobiia bacterium]|nr:hypothetical protein [Acidimicrobiia bacterium]